MEVFGGCVVFFAAFFKIIFCAVRKKESFGKVIFFYTNPPALTSNPLLQPLAKGIFYFIEGAWNAVKDVWQPTRPFL